MDQEADCLWVPRGSCARRPLSHTGRNRSGSRGPEQPHSPPPPPGHPPRHHSKVHTLWSILRPSVTTWPNQKKVIQPLLHTLGLSLNNHQLFFLNNCLTIENSKQHPFPLKCFLSKQPVHWGFKSLLLLFFNCMEFSLPVPFIKAQALPSGLYSLTQQAYLLCQQCPRHSSRQQGARTEQRSNMAPGLWCVNISGNFHTED